MSQCAAIKNDFTTDLAVQNNSSVTSPRRCFFPSLLAAGLAVGLDPEGYGNPDFCWISIDDKLIWSFAGPIAIVILVNHLPSALLATVCRHIIKILRFQPEERDCTPVILE